MTTDTSLSDPADKTAQAESLGITKSKAAPFGVFERMVARRYMGATRKGAGVSVISVIAFVGIALAVMTLIIVMSIMNGFRGQLLDQLLSVNGHVFVQARGQVISDPDPLVVELLNIEGVVSAAPQINAPVYLSTTSNETGALARGISREDLQSIEVINGPSLRGSLETFGEGRNGGNEIVLGSGVASTLRVGVGDRVTLMTGNGASTPFGTSPTRKTYLVGAIYNVGNFEFDNLGLYMPMAQAKLFFKQDGADVVEVKIEDPNDVEDFRLDVMRAATLVLGPDAARIETWQDRHAAYFGALQTERFMLMIILSFLVALTTLNIISGLFMLVKDKRSEIAILRTIGASQNAIMRIFFMSGTVIGVLGTAVGVILGLLFCLNIDAIENGLSGIIGGITGRPDFDLFPAEIYMLDGMPAQVNPSEVLFVTLFSVAMSFVATIYPSRKAARTDPVEALRYE